jgi:branched-chain amino acid transport system permease protein
LPSADLADWGDSNAATALKNAGCTFCQRNHFVIFGIDVASIILGGLAAGMVLFIVSVGLSVTMGLMGFVNLAHGAFAMLGGYVVVALLRKWQFVVPLRISFEWFTIDFGTIVINKPFEISLVPSLLLAAVIVGLISVVLEQALYRRLYGATELDQVLFTIGLILVMIALVSVIVGPENQPITLPPWLQGQLDLGFTTYRTYSIALIVIGTAIVIGLWLGFERTRFGAQIRAAVDNRRMAESLGINIDRLFSVTFAFGSGMAAIGGGLGAEFLGLDPQYPLKYLVFFLIVVAVGGPGRIFGAFYAAAMIGVLDFALKRYYQQGGTLFIYVLTIVLLLLRPQGLFGKSA